MAIALNLLTLVVASFGAWLTFHASRKATEQRDGQARRAEGQARREEWWRRFEYATSLALEPDDPARANIGAILIRALIESDLAGHDELTAADRVLAEVTGLGDTGATEEWMYPEEGTQ